MAGPLEITPEDMATYRASARRQWAKRLQAIRSRRTQAHDVARQAATLLKDEYGADRVMLFGSLARDESISSHSDIDLAVWGLDEQIYYHVVSRLLNLDPSISIDLVRVEDAAVSFREMIDEEGIPL
jgi:uncharacterized protein